MKKKELLIIFLLAVLVTIGSWFYVATFETCIPSGWWIFGMCLWGFPPYPIIQRGFPIYYWTNWPKQAGSFIWSYLIIDVFFWFLVLIVGWWIIKKLKGVTRF